MCITLISSIVFKNNLFGIGSNNDLLYKIPEDLKRFKEITKNKIVVMGYNTWCSLPIKPLKDRINIVLSKNHNLLTNTSSVIFTDFKTFKKNYDTTKEYYVIGGSEIFFLFLKELKPNKLILNHIKPNISKHIDVTFSPELISKYKLIGYSQEYPGYELTYRYLYYEFCEKNHQEHNYISIMQDILDNGITRIDRTLVGTISVFGRQCRFDIEHTIPLITTRFISFKNILEELLWFCRGETDSKILESKGVNIWRGNTTSDFLKNRGLAYKEGEAGPIYGKQWRRYGNTGIDQLAYVENLIKTDPYSRRIILNSWNPEDLNKMCLTPCHTHAQWYVEKINGKDYLSCQFYQRSQDTFLAITYNIVSYTVLTYILAKKCNMTPKEIIYVGGDMHIYKNHMEQVKEQLSRLPRPFPSLKVSDKIKNKSWEEIDAKDFCLIGYFPAKSISAPMAV